MRDLVFLVADKAMEQMVRGFFGKERFHESLKCGEFSFDPRRDLVVARGRGDGGVHRHAGELLSQHGHTHRHAVVMLDSQRSWTPAPPTSDDLRKNISARIEHLWPPERHVVIVVEPEIEAWLWQDHPRLDMALGITRRPDRGLREILRDNGHWPDGERKPPDPKVAWQSLWGPPYYAERKNLVFRRVAEQLSVKHCVDEAFQQLRETLGRWFPCA